MINDARIIYVTTRRECDCSSLDPTVFTNMSIIIHKGKHRIKTVMMMMIITIIGFIIVDMSTLNIITDSAFSPPRPVVSPSRSTWHSQVHSSPSPQTPPACPLSLEIPASSSSFPSPSLAFPRPCLYQTCPAQYKPPLSPIARDLLLAVASSKRWLL